MPKQDGLGQGGDTGWATSPLTLRQQLSPMPPAEAEAFDWVMKKLSEHDPEADVRDLIEDGLDEGWFLVDEQGMLQVNPAAPDAKRHPGPDDKPPPQYEGSDADAGPG